MYFGLSCDEIYIPPDGGLDLRGFSAAATFVRGVFEKIGINEYRTHARNQNTRLSITYLHIIILETERANL